MTSQIHTILIIDDDPVYASMLSKGLVRAGFSVLSAATGRAGLALAEARRPQLILLDINLPDTDGIKLYEVLRQNPRTSGIPVIMITGLNMLPSVMDAVASGMKTEPAFSKTEGLTTLLRRIRGAIKPTEQSLPLDQFGHGQLLRRGPLVVDLRTRQFSCCGKTFPPLAPQRFSLLCALMRGDGPVSREKLLLEVWGELKDPKVVDVTIGRLRRDLKGVKQVSIQPARHGYTLVFIPAAHFFSPAS